MRRAPARAVLARGAMCVVLGVAVLLPVSACTDSTSADTLHRLGTWVDTRGGGLDRDNPSATPLPGGGWSVSLFTGSGCPMVRSEIEVIGRGTRLTVLPYEVVEVCPARILIFNEHTFEVAGEGYDSRILEIAFADTTVVDTLPAVAAEGSR